MVIQFTLTDVPGEGTVLGTLYNTEQFNSTTNYSLLMTRKLNQHLFESVSTKAEHYNRAFMQLGFIDFQFRLVFARCKQWVKHCEQKINHIAYELRHVHSMQ